MSNTLRLDFAALSIGTCFTTGGYFSFILTKKNYEQAEIVGYSDSSEAFIVMNPEDVVFPVFAQAETVLQEEVHHNVASLPLAQTEF